MKQTITRQPLLIILLFLQSISIILNEDVTPFLFISIAGSSLLYFAILFLITSKYQKHKEWYHVGILFIVLAIFSSLLFVALILIFKIPSFFLMLTSWSFCLMAITLDIFVNFKANNYFRK